jgi:hypothetical protein
MEKCRFNTYMDADDGGKTYGKGVCTEGISGYRFPRVWVKKRECEGEGGRGRGGEGEAGEGGGGEWVPWEVRPPTSRKMFPLSLDNNK